MKSTTTTLLILMIISITALLLFLSSSPPAPPPRQQHYSPITIRRHLLDTSSTEVPNPHFHDHKDTSPLHHSKKHYYYYSDCTGSGRTRAGVYNSRSLCLELQEIIHSLSPPRRRKSSLEEAAAAGRGSGGGGEEIDPRYGVEKRLVPSGPNPLHN
ncbi:unnamed protein product [Linum trigynum]|uniref:Uncharacterized protein n=1 Tax=Linum trigynum TaxID=586398 RepID=A0AAV2CUP8_9ROSI